jgi:glycerophosphoryl diester phosphodiesterase
LNQQTVRVKPDHWLLNTKIAHRGLHDDLCPENSLIAFQQAVDHQYAIELDIHLLADNEIVIFHDNDLKRMVGIDKEIKDIHSSHLAKYKLNDTEESIPLLKDVLKLVAGKVPIVIEIKNTKKIGKLEKLTYELIKDYKGPLALQSFNPLSLAWYRRKLPEVPRGMLSTVDLTNINFLKRIIIKNYFLYPLVAPSYIAQDLNSINFRAVNYLKTHCDIPLIAWTVRSLSDFDKVKNYCENIIFEGFTPSV